MVLVVAILKYILWMVKIASLPIPPTTPMPPPHTPLDQNYLGVNLWWFYFVSRTFKSRDTCVFRRAECKWLKEPKWKSSQILQFRARFCRNCKFLFSMMEKCPGGIFWAIFRQWQTPGTPRKSGFFQRKGRKRVKEWREVTFMKEWVKALDDTRILAPADLR